MASNNLFPEESDRPHTPLQLSDASPKKRSPNTSDYGYIPYYEEADDQLRYYNLSHSFDTRSWKSFQSFLHGEENDRSRPEEIQNLYFEGTQEEYQDLREAQILNDSPTSLRNQVPVDKRSVPTYEGDCESVNALDDNKRSEDWLLTSAESTRQVRFVEDDYENAADDEYESGLDYEDMEDEYCEFDSIWDSEPPFRVYAGPFVDNEEEDNESSFCSDSDDDKENLTLSYLFQRDVLYPASRNDNGKEENSSVPSDCDKYWSDSERENRSPLGSEDYWTDSDKENRVPDDFDDDSESYSDTQDSYTEGDSDKENILPVGCYEYWSDSDEENHILEQFYDSSDYDSDSE